LTSVANGSDIAQSVEAKLPGSILAYDKDIVWVKPEFILPVCKIMKDPEGLDFSFLAALTAVDFIDHFEIIYHLTSMRRNSKSVLKCACHGRENPTIASVTEIWRGADLQEREIWDLMGIKFEGHPNLKRIMLWEGFEGHPLRKDYLG